MAWSELNLVWQVNLNISGNKNPQRWKIHTSSTFTLSHSTSQKFLGNTQSSPWCKGIKLPENWLASPEKWNSQVGEWELGLKSVWVSAGSLISLLAVKTWFWWVFPSSSMVERLALLTTCPSLCSPSYKGSSWFPQLLHLGHHCSTFAFPCSTPWPSNSLG